jgi:hypothetical protein
MTEVFQMVPAPAKAMWFFALVCAMLIGLTGLLGYLAWSTRHTRFEVSSESLRLRGDLWGRTLPLSALELDRARVPRSAPAAAAMTARPGAEAHGA